MPLYQLLKNHSESPPWPQDSFKLVLPGCSVELRNDRRREGGPEGQNTKILLAVEKGEVLTQLPA